MKKKTLIALTAALMVAGSASAQFKASNNLFYHSFRSPQGNLLNPAMYPGRTTIFLMLPGAGIDFSSPLGIGDILQPGFDANGNEISVVNFNDIIDRLNEDNHFRLNADIPLLGFGLKIRNTFITANAQLHANFALGIPVDVFNTINQGNIDANGNPIPMIIAGNDLLNGQAYAEVGIGLGHKFPLLGLTVGARAKLLYGIANFNLDKTQVKIDTYTDPSGNVDRMDLDLFYQLQVASAVPLDTADGKIKANLPSVNDLLNINSANSGYAFDLGLRYDLGPFRISASVTDMSSGIHWRQNVATVSTAGGHDHLSFTGVELDNLLSGGSMNINSLTDSLNNFVSHLSPDLQLGGEYIYNIPTRFNLGASFSLARMLRVGLLFHSQLDRGIFADKEVSVQTATGEIIKTFKDNPFRWNTTLSADFNLFNWLELVVASSVVKDETSYSWFNPGVGLIFTPATVLQTYVMADYVSSIYMAQAKSFNVKFGINVLIGRGGHSHTRIN